MTNPSILLSIVTPTYNRAHLLHTCFDSLLNQTDLDFEWIIVDDGSTDDTAAVVSGFQTEHFPIRYIQKKNGGKHTALNASMEHIRGEYLMILDSDDYLTPDAVETVRKYWALYADQPNVAMVTLLKGPGKDQPNCIGSVTHTPVDIIRYKRIIYTTNDCCEVIRSEVFKRFPFPVFEGERFLSEGVLWNRVGLEFQCVYVNEVIYICEYLEGGLTKSGRAMRIRNPLGGMLSSQLNMHPKNFLTQRIKNGLLFGAYGFFAGLSPVEILSKTDYKVLTALCMLPGWMIYRYWRHKYL